ncbi:ArpA protein [Streptomyces sp. NPDC018029]|uniref:HalD/BesD family halogenase n=1 Tax=Streptomyces sp. NPDC018029 TaxID=3365032 RepID=UPI00378C98DD
MRPDDRIGGLVQSLSEHLVKNVEDHLLEGARRDFLQLGFAKLPFLVPDHVKSSVADEIESLVAEHGVRRGMRFKETGGTPRLMRNVRHKEISEHGSVIPAVYASADLLDALGKVAGEPVLTCPYEPERYVITELEQSGDTHGWHWDDYSFALVWVVACPPAEHGGFVQCVPRTYWNKQDPQLHRQFIAQPIHSFELRPGDLYLMRTDTTLHRVYPLSSGRRLIINMGYASQGDLHKQISHETMDGLWNGSRDEQAGQPPRQTV